MINSVKSYQHLNKCFSAQIPAVAQQQSAPIAQAAPPPLEHVPNKLSLNLEGAKQLIEENLTRHYASYADDIKDLNELFGDLSAKQSEIMTRQREFLAKQNEQEAAITCIQKAQEQQTTKDFAKKLVLVENRLNTVEKNQQEAEQRINTAVQTLNSNLNIFRQEFNNFREKMEGEMNEKLAALELSTKTPAESPPKQPLERRKSTATMAPRDSTKTRLGRIV
jgi:hypothetical protein